MSEFRVFGNFPETCRVSNSVLTTVGLLSIMSYYWFKCNSIVWYGFGTSLMLLDAKFRNPWSLGVCVCVCFAVFPAKSRAALERHEGVTGMQTRWKAWIWHEGVTNYCVYFVLLKPCGEKSSKSLT